MKVKFIRNYKGFKKGDIEEITDEEELNFLDKTKTIEKMGKEIKLDIPVEDATEKADEVEKTEEEVVEKKDEAEKTEEDVAEKKDEVEKTEEVVTEKIDEKIENKATGKNKKKVGENMSPFKEMLREDLNTFINIDEMGEKVVINKKEYIGILEHPDRDFKEEYEGISEGISLIIYLKENPNISKKRTGKSLDVNGKIYIINDSYEEEGLYVIKLSERIGM